MSDTLHFVLKAVIQITSFFFINCKIIMAFCGYFSDMAIDQLGEFDFVIV